MTTTPDREHRRARPTAAPIAIRLDPASRNLIRQAATLAGMPVSQFVRQHLLEAARRTITEEQVIRLSADAAARFVAALEADGPPPPALAKLLERHAAIPFVLPDHQE